MNEVRIKKITALGVKRVINLTVKKNHTFITANGIPTHNCDRISSNAADALKGILDQVEKNCRFIFTTNNYNKIIDPIKDRACGGINFDFDDSDANNMKKSYFKRMKFILETEKVTFDKSILAQFVDKNYPSLRKMILSLQKCYKIFGCIDERILSQSDETKIEQLILEMKNKKFNNVRKIISECDFDAFYRNIYDQIEPFIKDECKPDIIIEIGEWQAKAGLSADKEIPCVGLAITIMKKASWL